MNHAKRVAASFSDLLSNAEDEASVSEAARFYLEVLFLENSLPLHRTLVSALAKVRHHHALIGACLHALCDEYGGGKRTRFCVSRVALSVLGMPKLGYLANVIEECAILVARDAVSSLDGVVSETEDLARPSPIVMEQCQEALSCLYYLLQRFPSKFTDCNGAENVLGAAVTVILNVLNSTAFSRDCFVAAGVSFCAALQARLNAQELGFFIIEGIFYQTTRGLIELRDVIAKVPYKGDLYSEVRNFSVLSRLCLIRGILTSVSRNVLNAQFDVLGDGLNGNEGGGNSVKTILYDGILP